MNQTLCGPGWAVALDKGNIGLSKTYGSAPDLAIHCCPEGQKAAAKGFRFLLFLLLLFRFNSI